MVRESTKLKRLKLKQFAAKIRQNIPRSERWFMSHFLPYRTIDDEFNVPFACYIPDVINRKYKYIIEVDGSIHDTEAQKKKDIKKDKKYRSTGYKVFRVKAYDNKSLQRCLDKVCGMKGPYFKPAKIYKPKAQIEIGSGPENCMVLGDDSRGCLIEMDTGKK